MGLIINRTHVLFDSMESNRMLLSKLPNGSLNYVGQYENTVIGIKILICSKDLFNSNIV